MPDPTIPPGPTVFDNIGEIAKMEKQFGMELLKAADNSGMAQPEKDRHRIYILLVMKLVRSFWNGNKNGPVGNYNYRPKQFDGEIYDKGEPYYGHNIAAILVDSTRKVTDFDFNHSQVFLSSIEHAEARLVRRMYSLAGLTTDKPLREHTQL